MRVIILIFCLLSTFSIYAENITVSTGYGYFVDSGDKVRSKAELPKGSHPVKEGYAYYEVEDKRALNKIDVWIDPKIPATAKRKEKARKKVAKKLRELGLTKQEIKDALGLDEDGI